MKDYTEFPDLAGVYLDDSYVLGITETPDSLAFALEVVLTPDHPSYHEPKPGEKYCYVNALLTISGAREIRWLERTHQTYTDATGEVDLGNIDSLRLDGDHYDIIGDWGHVWVYTTAAPRFVVI